MKVLTEAMQCGDLDQARSAQFSLRELNQVMFMQSNPIPVKAACVLLGWMGDEMRLPLLPLSGTPLQRLKDVMLGFTGTGEKLEPVHR